MFSLDITAKADTPPVAVYEIKAPDAFFTFHYLNSFAYTPENDSKDTVIVLDMCAYYKMDGVLGAFIIVTDMFI